MKQKSTEANEGNKADLQLVASLPTHAEKNLIAHKKQALLFAKGERRSGAAFFGYAYLLAGEISAIKELLPHGEFGPWLEQNLPDFPRSRVTRYLEFKRAMDVKLPTVGNLKGSPLLISDGKKPSKKELETILKLVPEAMDGKGMMEFMRASKFVPEKQKQEFHPAKKLTASEELELKLGNAREEFGSAELLLRSSNESFVLLTDAEIDGQLLALEMAVKLRRAWLKMPAPRDVKKLSRLI